MPEVEPLKRQVKHIGIGGVHRRATPRHRALRPEKVKELAESMERHGQLQPIVVRPCEGKGNGYWLVAGAHRREAAKKLNWSSIQCVILSEDESDEVAELIEIDENLIRADLDAAERALHITRRKAIYEALYPETKVGKAPGKKGGGKVAKNAKSASFASDTAAKTGRSKRSIEVDAKRGAALGDDLSRIAGNTLAKGTELDALAAMAPEEREPIIAAAEQGEAVTAICARVAVQTEVGSTTTGSYTWLDEALRKRIEDTWFGDDDRELAALDTLPEADRKRTIEALIRGELETARTDLSELERAWLTFWEVAMRSTREEKEAFYSHDDRVWEVERFAQPTQGVFLGMGVKARRGIDLYAPFDQSIHIAPQPKPLKVVKG